jgi:hypothetical protein
MKNKSYLLSIFILVGILVGFRNAKAADLPDYFICSYWEDTNNDGLLDANEFVNVTNTFNADEDTIITFVGYYYDSKGKEIGLKIYQPDGTLYSDKTAEVEFEPTHVHRWWYVPSTLVSAGGAGDWKAEWYLDGELVHTETFTLTDILNEFSSIFNDLSASEGLDFFACDSYSDTNGDGYMDRDEYFGIKDTFTVEDDSTITVVSYWHNSYGKIINIKIYDPNGYVWYDDTGTVEDSTTYIYRWWFNTKTMASEGELGNWTVKWYLNDIYANSITVNIDKKYASTALIPQFVVCKYWSDLNKDGLISEDMSEFIGIKNSFQVGKDTEVTFISHWVGKKGMVRKIVIYDPDDAVWITDTLTIKSNDTYWHPGYYTKSMYNSGGAGKWTVKWYLNDVFVESKDFTIVK